MIEKRIIGLEEKHIDFLNNMINKDDKRFKNKSAIIRTILDCLCSEDKKDNIKGILVIRDKSASAMSFDQNMSEIKDILEGANKISINAEVNKDYEDNNVPTLEITITNNSTHRL